MCIRIPHEVFDALAALVKDHDDPTTETGGIMVGHDRGWSMDVTGIGAPGPLAVHETTRFNRDLTYASEVAADAWQRDRSQWIGEWHTHPGGRRAPSRFDLQTYASLLRNPSLRLNRLIAVIVTPSPRIAAAVWIVTRWSVNPVRICVIQPDNVR